MIPEQARRATWSDLLDHPDVVEVSVLAAPVGLMAFHGGLEGGTLEIATAAAAASGASLYTVAQPAGLRWHVPSNTVDPARSPRSPPGWPTSRSRSRCTATAASPGPARCCWAGPTGDWRLSSVRP